MMNSRLSRRSFLRGSAGVALSLPLLDAMQPAKAIAAENAQPPIRLGCLYIPNGVPFDAWKPDSSDGRLTKMNARMSALDPFVEQVTMLTGLQSETKGSHPGAGATWLVRPCPEGDRISAKKSVGSASMDQIVARAVGSQTPFASLELITKPEGSFSKEVLRNNISWRNGTTPVPRESDPRAVFNRLTGREQTAAKVNRDSQRQSILDAVLEDAHGLRLRVSNDDRHKIDEYLEAVRGVENRMSGLAVKTQAAAREKAASFPAPPEEIPDDHGAYLRLMFDMLVLAYWTDSTRVASFMIDHEQSNRYFSFLPGVKGMWHAISHWGDISGKSEDDDGKTSWSSKEAKYEQYLKVIEYHHQHVAYFFERLNEIKEGDGTLLDHCMILYGAPFSDGNDHASDNLPIMLAGGGGGKLRPGQVLHHPDAPSEGIYLSMMDVMGVPVSEIGGVDAAVRIA